MQWTPGINSNRSLKENDTIYELVSVSIRTCTGYEHFLWIGFKLISSYFYLFSFKSHFGLIHIVSNIKIDLTLVFYK